LYLNQLLNRPFLGAAAAAAKAITAAAEKLVENDKAKKSGSRTRKK